MNKNVIRLGDHLESIVKHILTVGDSNGIGFVMKKNNTKLVELAVEGMPYAVDFAHLQTGYVMTISDLSRSDGDYAPLSVQSPSSVEDCTSGMLNGAEYVFNYGEMLPLINLELPSRNSRRTMGRMLSMSKRDYLDAEVGEDGIYFVPNLGNLNIDKYVVKESIKDRLSL